MMIQKRLSSFLFIRKITIYQSFIQYIKAGNAEVSDIKLLNLLSDCEEKLNIKTRVELSCDEKIISVLDDKAKREYGDTLISFMKSKNIYKSSLASVTLTEGAEQLKERLNAIMNFKKKTRWGIFISLLLTVMLVCGFTVSGAYAANRHNQTKLPIPFIEREQR